METATFREETTEKSASRMICGSVFIIIATRIFPVTARYLRKAVWFLVTTLALLISPGTVNAAEYIGRNECKGCHAEQNERWQGSHHDLAMQEATPEAVQGDFGNAKFEQFGVVSNGLLHWI